MVATSESSTTTSIAIKRNSSRGDPLMQSLSLQLEASDCFWLGVMTEVTGKLVMGMDRDDKV
jgi:hypothetical protein